MSARSSLLVDETTIPAELAGAFWRHVGEVSESWPWDAAHECWPWLGPRGKDGYGLLHWRGTVYRATRVSWSLAHGRAWPRGMIACHRCDNPPCVRPEHIWPGSSHENALDRTRKRRHRLHEESTRFADRLAVRLAERALNAAEYAAAAAEQAEWALARAAWAVHDERFSALEGEMPKVVDGIRFDAHEAMLTRRTAERSAAAARRAHAAAAQCSAAGYGAAIAAARRVGPAFAAPWGQMYGASLPAGERSGAAEP